MPPKRKRSEIPKGVRIPPDKITATMQCRFCHQGKTQDLFNAGDLYSLTVDKKIHYYHYFCILFSKDGQQLGRNEDGILGFLPEDIEKEFKRGQKFKCDLCKKLGGTVECRQSACRAKFHFTCGAQFTQTKPEKEHFFIFNGSMQSFCPLHIRKQKKLSGVVYKDECPICMDEHGPEGGPAVGRFACKCGGLYHRHCIQQLALSGGIQNFACPLCKCKEKFQDEATKYGIYIPHAPESWEEDEAFYQWRQHTHYRSCCAKRCLCKDGKSYDAKGTKYELYVCDNCGGNSIHIECGRLNRSDISYNCEDCKAIVTSESEDDEEQVEENEQHDDVIVEPSGRNASDSESEPDENILEILDKAERQRDQQVAEMTPSQKKLKEIQDALLSPDVSDEDDDIQVVSHVQPGIKVKPTIKVAWGSSISSSSQPADEVQSQSFRKKSSKKSRVPPPPSRQLPPPASHQLPPPDSHHLTPPSSRQLPLPSSRQLPLPSPRQLPPPSSRQLPPPSFRQLPPPSSRQLSPPSSRQPPPPSLTANLGSNALYSFSPAEFTGSRTISGADTPAKPSTKKYKSDLSLNAPSSSNSASFQSQGRYAPVSTAESSRGVPPTFTSTTGDVRKKYRAHNVWTSSTGNPEPEEILLSSSEDEAEPLGIEICEVIGREDMERRAKAEYSQSKRPRVQTKPGEGSAQTRGLEPVSNLAGKSGRNPAFSTSEVQEVQCIDVEDDDDIRILDDVLPPPVPTLKNYKANK